MQADCRLQCNARIYMKIMTLTAVLTTSKLHNQCSLIKFICLLLKPPYIYTAATRLRLSFKFNDFAKLKMNSIIVWWICWRSDLENFNLFLTVVNWLSSRLCMQVKMGFSCLIISFQHCSSLNNMKLSTIGILICILQFETVWSKFQRFL